MKGSFTLSNWFSVLKGGKKIYHFSELLRLSGLSKPALRRAVQRMRQKKILLLLGKGLFANSFALPNLEEITGFLYPPSYISLESALFMHGVMDQAPYVLSCVTTNKTKTFETDLGEIHYLHIKKDLFFGYEIVKQVPLAFPEKAALDFVYIQRKNGFQPVLNEWNWENLDKSKLEDFMTVFPKSVQNHIQKYRNLTKSGGP
jgi:predicted transcriptional regulator of viral defense system